MAGKQISIIKNNEDKIKDWHNEHRPTDWIARQLRVSRELLKKTYPEYKGAQGGFNEECKVAEENYNLNPKHCKQCQNPLSWESNRRNNYKSTFCGASCAAIYNNQRKVYIPWSEERKQAYKELRKTMTCVSRERNPIRYKDCVCTICKNIFRIIESRIRKTCSDECYSKLMSSNARNNPNCGGETNYKRYFYKDVMMDSSWEVTLAKYLDENNIQWVRSRKNIFYWTDDLGQKRRYYPDFYLPDKNVYLDPKNPYKLKLDEQKLERVKKENNITLLVGNVQEIISQLPGA